MSTTLKDNDSDSDVEFEDVPLPTATNDTPSLRPSLQRAEWTPTLYLPQQRDVPIPHGSEEETQLRDRLSHGIDRINYRRMKADMDMDAPGTRASLRRYESFKELAGDVEHLVDMLWVSATPSIQVEGLITLAGITEMSLETFTSNPFDPHSTLGILHKFDVVFAALCTGMHPLTHAPLPGAQEGRSLVTQTQKVRIRSLAETTRNSVFLCLPGPDWNGSEDGDGDGEDEEEVMQPWVLEATRVYDRTLMLLADQGGEGGGGDLYGD